MSQPFGYGNSYVPQSQMGQSSQYLSTPQSYGGPQVQPPFGAGYGAPPPANPYVNAAAGQSSFKSAPNASLDPNAYSTTALGFQGNDWQTLQNAGVPFNTAIQNNNFGDLLGNNPNGTANINSFTMATPGASGSWMQNQGNFQNYFNNLNSWNSQYGNPQQNTDLTALANAGWGGPFQSLAANTNYQGLFNNASSQYNTLYNQFANQGQFGLLNSGAGPYNFSSQGSMTPGQGGR